jgi:hypothetical protein
LYLNNYKESLLTIKMGLEIIDYMAPRDWVGQGREAEKRIYDLTDMHIDPFLKSRGFRKVHWIKGYWQDKETSYIGPEGIVQILSHIEFGMCPNPAQFGIRVISSSSDNGLTRSIETEFPALIRTIPEQKEIKTPQPPEAQSR